MAIAVNDLQSAVIVLIALPLIPVFMVLIGLATAERSAAALGALTTLQTRLMDLVAGVPACARWDALTGRRKDRRSHCRAPPLDDGRCESHSCQRWCSNS